MRLLIIIIALCTCTSCDFHSVRYYHEESEKLTNQEKYAEAILLLNKLLEKDSDDIYALLNRGSYKSRLQDFKGAIEDFSKVINIDSKNTLAYFHRGMNKYNLKKFYEAIEDYNAAISTKGGDLIYIEYVKNDFIETGYKFDVKMEEIRFERGCVYYDIDSLEASFNDFNFCKQKQYEEPACEYMIGMIYISVGDKKNGCQALIKSKELGDPYAQNMIEKYCR